MLFDLEMLTTVELQHQQQYETTIVHHLTVSLNINLVQKQYHIFGILLSSLQLAF